MNEYILTSNQDIKEIKAMLKILLPKEFSVSYIAQQTGKSHQAVKQWLERNAEPEVDYYLKRGKIIVSEQVALKYISRRRDL